MQWDYVRGRFEHELPMKPTRQRVEDYYIMKSIETTLEQIQDITHWLQKKENKLLYFDENDVNAIRESFQALRGRKRKNVKIRLYGIKCPEKSCGQVFDAQVALEPFHQKNARVKWQITNYCPSIKEEEKNVARASPPSTKNNVDATRLDS